MISRALRGFSLIELLAVVSIIAILAGIAVPQYGAYVQRSRLVDALTRLADARARMEQYFLDRRAYVDDAGRCGVPAPAAAGADAFALTCVATASTYTYTATGLAAKGMAAFTYTIDQSGQKATVAAPGGWTTHPDCWTIRQDGLCV